MEWFSMLLAATVVVRGLGAGLIYDVALVSLPVRRQIGAISFAEYARALFMNRGARVYAPVAILGAFLTLAVTIGTFTWGRSAVVTWAIVISMISTVFAFWGTFRALPTMLSLQQVPNDEPLLAKILDRFAYWHTFSAMWQLASFIALVVALANQ